MADIELVIKIPEEDYDDILNGETKASALNWSTFNAIRDGTPLPKHHGRLISEEDMLSVILFSKLFDDAKVGEVKEALLNIPTIIEAYECTYKETGCGSCKRQLDCPIEAKESDTE